MISPTTQAKGPVFAVVISEKGGAERREVFDVTELSLGRVQGNDVMLPKGNVSKRHARLLYRDGRFIVTDLNSTNGTYVNRRRIAQATIVREGDRIYIGDFVLRIEVIQAQHDDALKNSSSGPVVVRPSSPSISELSEPTISRRSGSEPKSSRPSISGPAAAAAPGAADPFEEHSSARMRLPQRELALSGVDRSSSSDLSGLSSLTATLSNAFAEIATAVGEDALAQDPVTATEGTISALLDDALKPLGEVELPTGVLLDQLKAQLRGELVDVGPLASLLAEDAVTEISIGRFDRIMAVRDGQASLVVPAFSCEAALRLALGRLCIRSGAPLEEDEELVERRLKDGTRLSAVLGPVAPGGALCVLRKSHPSAITVEDLVRRGTVSRAMATFLQHALAGRANILLVGSRDAALEVALNALSTACDDSTLLAVEDMDELIASSPRTRRLSVSGLGDEISQLLRLALRIGDSRLLVDLGTGESMAAVLEAITDGADGVFGTLRAPSLPSALTRLSSAVASCRPGMNMDAAREWLSSCFDVVLEVRRLRDGRYRVLRLCELGTAEQGFSVQDIFSFVVERTAAGGAIEGTFSASGIIPRFVEQLNARGYSVDTSLFTRPPSR